jgi:hypothetical protein
MNELLKGLSEEPWLLLALVIFTFWGIEACIRAWRK